MEQNTNTSMLLQKKKKIMEIILFIRALYRNTFTFANHIDIQQIPQTPPLKILTKLRQTMTGIRATFWTNKFWYIQNMNA